MVKNRLLRMDDMEPIAREATREALRAYREPSAGEQSRWTLGKFETEDEGIFEIYIPSDNPSDAKVISAARVNRLTGQVRVEIFLEE